MQTKFKANIVLRYKYNAITDCDSANAIYHYYTSDSPV